METKIIGQTLVCGIKVRTNMVKIVEHVGVKPQAVMDEIASQNINPTGPQIWYYSGCDGSSADAEFDLLISVPVESKGIDKNSFEFLALPNYKCVSKIHRGPWSELPGAYESFIGEIVKAGLTLAGTSREVYLNCDFENPQNCVTEIQMEVL